MAKLAAVALALGAAVSARAALSTARVVVDAPHDHGVSAPPAAPNLTFTLDAVFGDWMVLQQQPSMAAVYGYLPLGTGGPGVSVTVSLFASSNPSTPVATVAATLNSTLQPYGDGWGVRPCPKEVCPPYDMAAFTPWATPLPSWKALLPPMPPGGDYIVTASCTGCGGSPALSITNVTFGDVWYCSGQSNMWLPVQHTFSRNDSATNASNGAFPGIRLMAGSSGSVPYAKWPPAYGSVNGSNPWMTAAQASPAGCVETQKCPLFNMGGTCWYFAQALAERGVTHPIGILDTAIGGQRIPEFSVNTSDSLRSCSQRSGENLPWWDGQLFAQQVLPFVDMTLKGWAWLQAENDMGATKGNAAASVGYSCEMVQLIHGWRAAWSRVPNTTDPLAPFGLVTLASSGSEGGPDMGTMRWAQTGSYGTLPSPDLPNTFHAQAYDLDDPWGPEAGPCFAASGAGSWACCEPKYNATTCNGREALCAPACAANADTASVMGGIHPRNKKPVGERLGQAAYNLVYGGTGAVTGPTLAGCSFQAAASAASSLRISFNTSLLAGDSVVLQPIPPFVPPSRYQPLGGGGSQLWVQTNASLFCLEPQCAVVNQTSGQCETPKLQICPTWAGGDGTTTFDTGALDSGWILVNFTLVPSATGAASTIQVDLTPLNGSAPTAVRYAWGIIDCCDHSDPNLYVTHGCEATCPIMSSSGLPANPFQAKIVGGTCECVAPQVCGGGTM